MRHATSRPSLLAAAAALAFISTLPLPARAGGVEILQFEAVCSFGICAFVVEVEVTFQQQFSGSPTLFEYDWDGDGTFDETDTSAITSHAFPGAGTFFPVLRISDASTSDMATHAVPITILDPEPPPPGGGVTITGPAKALVGQNLAYTAGSAGCSSPPTSWTWAFPGGSGAPSGNTLSVSYASVGVYPVQLQANNGNCSVVTATKHVIIVTEAVFSNGFESGDVSQWTLSLEN